MIISFKNREHEYAIKLGQRERSHVINKSLVESDLIGINEKNGNEKIALMVCEVTNI